MKFYAGIGSRDTPPQILAHMTAIAHTLRGAGTRLEADPRLDDEIMVRVIGPSIWLRTGGAKGADAAFERGAGVWAHIYLPWNGFITPEPPGEEPVTYTPIIHDEPSPEALAMAAEFHPAWGHCTDGARLLLARNCHIILGDDLKTPVWRVICWTPEASLNGANDKGYPLSGGTNHALRIAAAHKITVTNLRRPKHLVAATRTQWAKLALDELLGDKQTAA